jgi:hypothetical protein
VLGFGSKADVWSRLCSNAVKDQCQNSDGGLTAVCGGSGRGRLSLHEDVQLLVLSHCENARRENWRG